MVLLLGVLGAPARGAAQSGEPVRPEGAGDPANLVYRFVAALNTRDLGAALACFADDALYGVGPNGSGGSGREFIRARLERDFSVNRRLTITALRVSGTSVSWSWEAR